MTETAGHVYADKYYDYIDCGSIRSADGVIPVARRHVEVGSVLDVGCGRGAWLRQIHPLRERERRGAYILRSAAVDISGGTDERGCGQAI